MATIVEYKGGWRAVIRRVGHKTRTKVFPNKSQAQRWVRDIEHEMDKGAYVAPSGTTARRLFERFRDEVSPLRKGAKWEQVRLNRFLRTIPWMAKKIEDVDRFDIQAWRDERLREISSSSVNRELNLISGVITHAMVEWAIALRVNPVHEIKRPPKGKPRTRRLSESEIPELDMHEPPRKGYGAVKDSLPWVATLAIETGMRMGELLSLRVEHLHLNEHWLEVVDSKNGDSRQVPLTVKAETLLRALGEIDDFVFPINKGSFGVMFRRWLADNGIDDARFHDSRHEAASRMAKKLTVIELAKTLGHRDPRSTMIYYNPTPGELAEKLRAGDPLSSVPARNKDSAA